MGFLGLASLLIIFWALVCSSEAYKFYVGGKDGWVLNPSEPFNHWAERNRFQVNDTLYFDLKNQTDSVLIVNKEDYFSCNTKNPISSLKNGEPIFKFDHSGPFYFIGANSDACQKGQKLIVVVLALSHEHHHHHQTSPPQAQTPTAESPELPDSPDSGEGIVTAPAPAPAKNSAHGSPVKFGGLGVGMINAVLLSSFFVGFL